MTAIVDRYLGECWRIRFVEEGPDLRFDLLPLGERPGVIGFLVAEHARHFFVAGLVRIQI